MTHPNVDVVRAMYEAHGRGDEAKLRELLAEDVVWHLPGRTSVAGEHHGQDALLGLWRREAGMLGGRVLPEVHDITASDDHVVVLSGATLQRQGRTLSLKLISVFHVREGRVTACWLHVAAGQDDFEELWS